MAPPSSKPERVTSRTAAYLAAFLLPAVLLVFPLGMLLTAPGSTFGSGAGSDYSTFGSDRVLYVLVAATLAVGLGFLAARTARPHSPWPPALAVAALQVAAGGALGGGPPQELVPFTVSLVLPPAYLLGTGLVARASRRDAAADRAGSPP